MDQVKALMDELMTLRAQFTGAQSSRDPNAAKLLPDISRRIAETQAKLAAAQAKMASAPMRGTAGGLSSTQETEKAKLERLEKLRGKTPTGTGDGRSIAAVDAQIAQAKTNIANTSATADEIMPSSASKPMFAPLGENDVKATAPHFEGVTRSGLKTDTDSAKQTPQMEAKTEAPAAPSVSDSSEPVATMGKNEPVATMGKYKMDGGESITAPVEAPEDAVPEDAVQKHGPSQDELAVAAAEKDPTKKGGGKSFLSTIGELASKYGMTALGILEAVGYQRAGINKEGILDKQYAEKIAKSEKDYMEKLAATQAKQEEETYGKRTAEERQYQAQQAALERAAEKERLGMQLSAEERIALQRASADKAAARSNAQLVPGME